jgi:branched-chain amino acid transport system permease protein
MYALTQTPLGRMANAVRDNPERAQFVGYNPQRVRFLMMILAGFFAGVAGGLGALNYEIATAETLSAHTSGAVIMMAFVGGVGQFFGPIIGAALITVLQIAVSSVTQAWMLYFGLFFMVMVLYAPGGIASLIVLHERIWTAGLLRRLLPSYASAIVPALLLLVGVVLAIEMAYAIVETPVGAPAFHAWGWKIPAKAAPPWIATVAVLAVGGLLLRKAAQSIGTRWTEVHVALTTREKPQERSHEHAGAAAVRGVEELRADVDHQGSQSRSTVR